MKFLKKYWFIILSFALATIMNIFHLIPSFCLDGYCSLCEGFKTYALTFVKAGRFATAFIYYFVDLIKLNPNIFSVLSIVLSNLILSIIVGIIYKDVSNLVKNKNKLVQLIIFIGAFLISFNPFNMEVYLFEESFAICLGFLFSILAGSIFASDTKHRFLKSLLLLFIATFFYQATLCLFIPYVFLLITLKNKDKNIIENIKNNFKNYLFGLLCYGCSLFLSFITLKLVLFIFELNSQKFGELNILTNIVAIFGFLKSVLRELYGFINTGYFYSISLVLICLYLGFLLTNVKRNYSKFIYILTMLFLCVITAFVPNLAMNSVENYTAARMAASIGAINGFLILMSFIFAEKDVNLSNYFYRVVVIAGSLCLSIYFLYYFSNSLNNYNRYKKDVAYITKIRNTMEHYEKTNGEIKKIKFSIMPNTSWYYKQPYNSINIRVNVVDWGMHCIIKVYVKRDAEVEMINYEDIINKDLIDAKEYKYTFEDDTMYFLSY